MTYTKVSIVYLSGSNALQQSIFNGNNWQDSPILPAALPPLNQTKLSSSSRILPSMNVSGSTVVPTPGTIKFPGLSSVVLYQAINRSMVMVDITPDDNFVPDSHTNPNLLDRLGSENTWESSMDEYIGEGFACTYNALNPVPTNNSQFYARLSFSDSGQPPRLSIVDRFHHYGFSALSSDLRIETDNEMRMKTRRPTLRDTTNLENSHV